MAVGLACVVASGMGPGESTLHAKSDSKSPPEDAPAPHLRGPKKRPAEGTRTRTDGSITISHARREITSCHRVQEEGRAYCDAAGYLEQPGQTEVAIVPLTTSGEVEVGAGRDETKFSFPNQKGKLEHRLELSKGRWEIRWKDGSTLKERFFVVPRDVFEIALESINGMCVEKAQGCKLDSGKRQRSVEVPKARALSK